MSAKSWPTLGLSIAVSIKCCWKRLLWSLELDLLFYIEIKIYSVWPAPKVLHFLYSTFVGTAISSRMVKYNGFFSAKQWLMMSLILSISVSNKFFKPSVLTTISAEFFYMLWPMPCLWFCFNNLKLVGWVRAAFEYAFDCRHFVSFDDLGKRLVSFVVSDILFI